QAANDVGVHRGRGQGSGKRRPAFPAGPGKHHTRSSIPIRRPCIGLLSPLVGARRTACGGVALRREYHPPGIGSRPFRDLGLGNCPYRVAAYPLFQRALSPHCDGRRPSSRALLSSSHGHGHRPAPGDNPMTRPPLLNFDGTPFPFRSLEEVTALLTGPGGPYAMGEVEVRGIRLRDWVAGPSNLRDVFVAGRAHGAKTFLVYEGERADFESFARATLAVAAELRSRGVGKGDRVAIAMRNLPEFPVAFFATVILGGIATPLNAWWTGPELEYALVDCGAKVAIVDAERLDRI